MRRFWIVLLLAVAASLVQPGVGGMLPTDLFGLAINFVAILLVAVAFYAAVLVVARLLARGRTLRMLVSVGDKVGEPSGPPSSSISPPSQGATRVEDLKERVQRLVVRDPRP